MLMSKSPSGVFLYISRYIVIAINPNGMMKNKIACSAERLGLLDPQMIQSVVESNAFRIGRQYVAENRVRIVEADDSQITSAVIGNSGLYEQTVRLKDGHLISKCSCTLSEDPMCRHSIAVLLEISTT